MPNAFSGTLFNNFKLCYESCALPTDRSNVYFFFLPSATDHAEKINRYFNSVKLSPMDVSEKSFNIKENGIFFGPSKLCTYDSQKKAIIEAIVKKMKETADLSNSNIVGNAPCLLLGKKISLNALGLKALNH